MTGTTSFISSNVLLAGGDEAHWKTLTETLPPHGTSVYRARSAGEVIEHLQRDPAFSLAAIDLDSQGMCDSAFVEALKERSSSIALLLESRSFDHGFLVDLLVSGTTFFLKRPYGVEEAAVALQRLLGTVGEREPPDRSPPRFPRTGVVLEYRTDEMDPGLVGARLTAILAATGACDARSAGLIEIAVHESLVNAVEHGNLELSSELKPVSADEPDRFGSLRRERLNDERYAARTVRVRFELDSEKMEVRICDQGAGFNHADIMANLSRRVAPESLTDCHGRGLLMVACCMDEVSFNETGNQITFVRYTQEESIRLSYDCRNGSE